MSSSGCTERALRPGAPQGPRGQPTRRRLLLALAALAGLAACGKKGQLELPPPEPRDGDDAG